MIFKELVRHFKVLIDTDALIEEARSRSLCCPTGLYVDANVNQTLYLSEIDTSHTTFYQLDAHFFLYEKQIRAASAAALSQAGVHISFEHVGHRSVTYRTLYFRF